MLNWLMIILTLWTLKKEDIYECELFTCVPYPVQSSIFIQGYYSHKLTYTISNQ